MNDIEPKVSLEALDPELVEPGYWSRFQGRVLDAVSLELARRRRAAFTLPEVVLSWGRLVLPGAAVAAAVAALLVSRPIEGGPAEGPLAALEDVLAWPVDGSEPLPAFLHRDEVVDRDVVLFAVEAF